MRGQKLIVHTEVISTRVSSHQRLTNYNIHLDLHPDGWCRPAEAVWRI